MRGELLVYCPTDVMVADMTKQVCTKLQKSLNWKSLTLQLLEFELCETWVHIHSAFVSFLFYFKYEVYNLRSCGGVELK